MRAINRDPTVERSRFWELIRKWGLFVLGVGMIAGLHPDVSANLWGGFVPRFAILNLACSVGLLAFPRQRRLFWYLSFLSDITFAGVLISWSGGLANWW